jgi:PTH2 family peptidyl-tRNA hydrolase
MTSLTALLPMFILRRVMRKHRGKLKQIIVLRTDLKMRRGKEIAQGAHASSKVILEHRRNPFVRMWLDGAFAKIAVGINGEEEFLELHRRAREAGIACAVIKDAGRTEFHGVETFTALAIGPGEPEKITELTGHLKLR